MLVDFAIAAEREPMAEVSPFCALETNKKDVPSRR
jgi:hypothetical protein